MSRYIDHGKPLSEADKEYLLTRSGGDLLIAENEAKFGHLSEDEAQEVSDQKSADDEHDENELAEALEGQEEPLDYDDDVIDRVSPLSFNELRQAVKKAGLKTEANVTKEELQNLLLDHYQDLKDQSPELFEQVID